MAAADEIAEKLAQKVSLTQNKLTLDREFNRIWKPQAGQLSAQVEAALNAITTVTAPQYENGTKSLPGLWRVAASGWNPQGQIYFQTLREGWASTVLNTTGVPNTLPDDEWMIQIGSDSRSDARSYTFLRRNVASSAVNAAVAALRTLGSWTDPTVQGESKTGSYVFANIVPAQQADGSYWITIEAIRTATIAAISDLYPLSPIRQDSHDIENAFGLEGGFVGHIGNKPTDGIVLTFRALSVASRAVILSLTDSQLQGILSNDEQLKYEFIKRDLVEDAGNTLKLSLAYQYIPLATTTPESAARKVSFGLSNQSGKLTLVRSWPRLDPAYSKDLLTANVNQKVTDGVVVDPMVDGVTYTGSWLARTTIGTMTGNDGDRIVQTMIKEGDQSLNLMYWTDPTHQTYELWRVDVSVAKIADFMAQTGSEAVGVGTPIDFKWDESEAGKAKSVKVSSWNEDRSANLHAIYTLATSWQYPAASATPANDFVLVNNLNGVVQESTQRFKGRTTIPAANPGELVKALENELNLFDGQIIKRAITTAAGGTGYVTVWSSVTEWDLDKSDVKIPIWTTSTDSNVPQRISGYNVYQFRLYTSRTVTVKITRTYSMSHPTIESITTATPSTKGGGTSQIKQIVELGDGLFAVDVKDITTGSWVVSSTDTIGLYSYLTPP